MKLFVKKVNGWKLLLFDDNFSEREVIVSLKSNFSSFIGVDCKHCSKFSLLYNLCVSHSGNILINVL